MSRKDSKGMFAAVLGQLGNDDAPADAAPRSASPHLMKVAAGVRQMQERSDMAEKLLKEGEQIVELDPDTILPSSIPDRYDVAYNAVAISEIVDSMRERGQIVPGLVRPSRAKPGAFQIVYGRRRLAAAKKLGIKFKAAVRELTDDQAVIFQGEENTAREDLSYIEKCAFAMAQEKAGYKRETICASLSTTKSHVSEMIKIGASVPSEILYAVGAAPGIGRGRWEDFARRYVISGNADRAAAFIGRGKFLEAASNDKFAMLLAALPLEPSAPKHRTTVKAAKFWAPKDNAVSVGLKDNGQTATLVIGAADGSRFANYIADQLDALYEAFKQSDTNTTGD